MTERTALSLVLVAMALATAISFPALTLLHVDPNLVFLTAILILGVGADTLARVVIHYHERSSERHGLPSKNRRR